MSYTIIEYTHIVDIIFPSRPVVSREAKILCDQTLTNDTSVMQYVKLHKNLSSLNNRFCKSAR